MFCHYFIIHDGAWWHTAGLTGFCFQKGSGVIKDESRAVDYYLKGVACNDPYAMTNLGVMMLIVMMMKYDHVEHSLYAVFVALATTYLSIHLLMETQPSFYDRVLLSERHRSG